MKGEDPRRNSSGILRREFLKKSLLLAGGLCAASVLSGLNSNSEAAKSLQGILKPTTASSAQDELSRALVIVARKERGAIDLETFYKLLLDASLKRLTGAPRPEDAWAKFFSPDDIVAIKVNSITGSLLSTSPVLVKAITDGLASCGVRQKNVIIWDRMTWELKAAGFVGDFAGEEPLCCGTDASSVGYESSPTVLGSVGSCFSRIIAGRATALINVPILREHTLAGVSNALKNNYGAIHNPNKYHANGCTPFVADVNMHPSIKKKTKLNISDAMRIQFHGGPGYKPKWISNFGGIMVSTDPVALDTVGAEQIEKLRKGAGLRSLREEKRYPGYLTVASDRSHALGISDRSRIDVINIELA